MKRILLLMPAFFFFCATPSLAELTCDPWVDSTWSLTINGQAAAGSWTFGPEQDLTQPPFDDTDAYTCVVYGTEVTPSGTQDMEVIVFNYSPDEYLYVPYQGRLTAQEALSMQMNAAGTLFTVTDDDFAAGILSGRKDGATIDCSDADGDGYGSGADCIAADCDDTSATIHPGAVEICRDKKDNNCDGNVDEEDCQDPPCPAAASLDGNEVQLAKLRQFRDSVLAKSFMGQKMIRLYYAQGDRLTYLIDENPSFKRAAKAFIDRLIPVIDRFNKK